MYNEKKTRFTGQTANNKGQSGAFQFGKLTERYKREVVFTRQLESENELLTLTLNVLLVMSAMM